MKTYNIYTTIFATIIALFMCLLTASCDNDKADEPIITTDEEVNYYNYSEHGFFMNGEIKVKGAFDKDSVITGYAKYVKRTACYRTLDGVEHEMTLGYAIVVEADNFAKFYSDDVTYKNDSTAINCKGELCDIAGTATSSATIDAKIDAVGKPHLITCHTTFQNKALTLQFRQTYVDNPYSDIKHDDVDNFDI